MSLELVTALSSVGTLIVIAASAYAALRQLRHQRGGNQILALTECREVLESTDFHAARLFVTDSLPLLMEDAAFRKKITQGYFNDFQPAATVGNFFESLGVFVKKGIIDKDIAADLWSGVVLECWKAIAPAAYVRRRSDPTVWENFEYLATTMRNWEVRYPNGTYPPAMSRMENADKWRDVDVTVT